MPGLGERTPTAAGAVWTPGRETEVTFDLDEVVATEPGWAETRRAAGIVPDRSAFQGETQVERLLSGYWIIKPLQNRLAFLHETTQLDTAIYHLNDFNAIATVKEEPLYRFFSEIIGLSANAGAELNTGGNGDLFFTLRRAAGSTWDSFLAAVGRPKPSQNENIVLDPVLECKVTDSEDQAYFLRWQCAGTHRTAPDALFNFYFGGPLFAEGYGEYCITFRGDGTCALFEFGLHDWHLRKEWQFCPAAQVMNAGHSMRVIPHMSQYIEFFSQTNAGAPVASLAAMYPAGGAHSEAFGNPSKDIYVVEASPRVFGTQTFVTVAAASATQKVDSTAGMTAGDTLQFFTAGVARTILSITDWQTVVLTASVTTVANELVVDISSSTQKSSLHPVHTTGMGRIRFDVRRDLRLNWQVSRLRYPPGGLLIDHPIQVPWGMAGADARIDIDGSNILLAGGGGQLTDIRSFMTNVQTGQPIPSTGPGTFTLPGDSNAIAVSLSLFSLDGTVTPFLRSYTVNKPAVQTTITPGEQTTAQVVDVQISGPTSDPTHESAQITIEDTLSALQRIRIRAGQSIRVRTKYDASDPTKTVVLFRGRVTRCDAQLFGWDEGQEYPDPDWCRMEISCVGEWQRIHENVMAFQGDFSTDPNADITGPFINGLRPPWKIKDMTSELIGRCGYPANQIDVTGIVSDLRLPLESDQGQLASPQGFLPVERFLSRVLQDYLDAFLFFDPNSDNGGFLGMWRAKQNPRINVGDVPLWSFTNDPPAAPSAGVTLLHRSEAYGVKTSPIRRGTFHSYVSPPEANALLVTAMGFLTTDQANTRMVADIYNPASYHPPGKTDHTDPDDQDYLGRHVPLVVVEPALSYSLDPATRRGILNFFTRRFYNQACRAVRHLSFAAELVLVDDANDVFLGGRKRPLRYGDFIQVDGENCLVTSANFSYQKDHLMEMYVECDVYRAPDETPPA